MAARTVRGGSLLGCWRCRRRGRSLCVSAVSEYSEAAAVGCRPSPTDRWRRTQPRRLRRGAVQKVVQALEPHLEPEGTPGTPEEEAPVRNAHRYLNNRRDCVDHPWALALGLPIGSGHD